MFIDDEGALRDWLVATLEPRCDAEPIALARYVLALVAKDKPLDKLRENCIDRLDVFLDRSTKDFVDQLFDVIRTRRYIPEGKKENVQPKASESHSEPQQKVEDIPSNESTPIPTTSSSASINQSTKRRHSSKHQSGNSPSAKRTQRSYSHSSTDSPPSPSSGANQIPSKDFDNKDYRDTSSYDHGSNISSFEPTNYYPTYQQYNPDIPDLTSSTFTRQSLPTGQRTLVTVVTNAEPLPLEQRLQRNHSGGPIPRTRRHVTTTPYPNDRRTQDQARKRPWQKSDGSGSSTTLELRKIPIESNTISKLNEHFSKFGTVTNVQIAFDGSQDSALVAYSTFQEAETAYRNPEPLFNNRFIKIFWHNSDKKPSSDVPSTSKPNPVKHQWTKPLKVTAPKKKSTTTPAGPSLIKKEAAKKAAIEIRRKKHGLFEEQIQQQKLLLKKLQTAETNEEKESIRALMKQVDSTIVTLKDSLRTVPLKLTSKLSQQDLLKQRAEKLKKELENLRAKTSADMRRAMNNTLETKLPNSTRADDDEEDRLLTDTNSIKKQQYEIETQDEVQLLDS